MVALTEHEPIHALDYGDSGGGKSSFAATFPKPMLVFQFDPFGKDVPYWRKPDGTPRGTPSQLFSDEKCAFVRNVYSLRDPQRVVIRIEYYHELGFTEPELVALPKTNRVRLSELKAEAYPRFLSRMSRLHEEYNDWKTVVLDSVTFMEICARKWDQTQINPLVEDPRQWWAGSTDMLESMLMMRFGGLPMNVVALAHIDREKAEAFETQLRAPMAPGRLRGNLSVAFQEVYHQYVDNKGQYLLQTEKNALFNAATRIGAPNPCLPTYRALWREQE